MSNVHEFNREEQQKIAIAVDKVVKEELKKLGLEEKINYEVAVDNVRSVGIQGDNRTYKRCAELKLRFPNNQVDYDLIERLSNQITNQVQEVNRVLCNFF